MEIKTVMAVALTLTFSYAGLGRTLPFDTTALLPLLSGLILFAAYLYLMRTVVRLPIALVITIQRTHYARKHYGLNQLESLRDGFTRGFLDLRRWTVGSLALVDRIALVLFTLLATIPASKILVMLGGFVGLALLLILYLMRGTFSGLVDDGAGRGRLI